MAFFVGDSDNFNVLLYKYFLNAIMRMIIILF
jgi:hypothetical protein